MITKTDVADFIRYELKDLHKRQCNGSRKMVTVLEYNSETDHLRKLGKRLPNEGGDVPSKDYNLVGGISFDHKQGTINEHVTEALTDIWPYIQQLQEKQTAE